MINKTCEICGNSFTGNAKKRFCSSKCKQSAHRGSEIVTEIVTEKEKIVTESEQKPGIVTFNPDEWDFNTKIDMYLNRITGERMHVSEYISRLPDEDENEDFKPHCKDCNFDPRGKNPNWFTNLHLKGIVKSKQDFLDKVAPRE